VSWTIEVRPDAFAADRVEARGLMAAVHRCETARQIEEISLNVGRVKVRLKDLAIVIAGDGPPDLVRLRGDFSRWDGIGFGMNRGTLIVEGNSGARTCAELAGGTVEIHGSCGSWAGAAMAGGRLVIHGDAGDWLGANWPGEPRGMTGGEIYVHGRAGSQLGVRMRRGLIAVAAMTGEGVGRGMIAGSIFLASGCTGLVGLGMKRGTIVLGGGPGTVLPVSATGFPRADDHRPLKLAIQLGHAAAAGWKASERMAQATVIGRFVGDRLNQGLGEIFVLSGVGDRKAGAI